MSTDKADTTPAKTMLSVKEFCAAVSIGRTLFYDEVRIGRIKTKKAGKRTLVPTTELDAWPERLPSPAETVVI